MGRFLLIAWVLSSLAGPAAAQTVLVREGDIWDFFRGSVSPPADWTMLDFDSTTTGWEEGATGIGYDDGDDTTELGDMLGNYMAVFLRIEFQVPAGMGGLLWVLRVRYDDSFVAYIDGEEVARRGITGDPPAFDQPADLDHESIDLKGSFDESILLTDAGAILLPGWHVLSAEVHNRAIDSSDLSFSAELVGSPFLVTSIQPALGQLEGGNTVTILGSGFDAADPPKVRFGGVESPRVVVVDQGTLQAEVPPGKAHGPVTVEIEDSRGRMDFPGGYSYSEPGEGGLSFDGGDSATASPFREDLDEGTFEVWFRRGGDTQFTRRVLLAIEAAGGGSDAFRLETRTNQVRARTWIDGNVTNLQAAPALGADEWHHIAFTFSRLGRKLYFDGTPVGSDALVMTVARGARLRLGAAFGTGTSFLGIIESARFFAFERAEREIRRDRFAHLDASAEVEAAWFLDEGQGSIAHDAGPNGFDLLLGDTVGLEGNDPSWVVFQDFPDFAVTEISPVSGPLSGGVAVRVFGTGFETGSPPEVLFGTVPSTEVTVTSPWELEAVAPPGAAYGPVDVTVQSPLGTIVLPGSFLYQPSALYDFAREGDLWDYFVGMEAPPSDWAQPEFDPGDRGWQQGRTGIGYGDDDDATPVAMENICFTLYARKSWKMAGRGEPIDYLRLRIRYDDGFVAYLNGEEIARRLVTGNPPAWDEPASDLHEITVGMGQFDEEIDVLSHKQKLREGLNVLAIEVHNATLDSSDLSLSAELIYSAPGSTFLRGDVDGSGSRNILDAIKIIRWNYEAYEISCEEAADIDNDGFVNPTDALAFLEYLFRFGPPLPAPAAEPAPDLDGDPLDCK